MHLFILCPPFSGSTLLWQVLGSSPAVASLPTEGFKLIKQQKLGRACYSTVKWWRDSTEQSTEKIKVNWPKVKQIWDDSWGPQPIKLEKTPAHLLKAFEIQEHFEDPRFIITIRDPYAFCMGILKRKRTLEAGARLWLKAATYQKKNLELNNTLFFTYEQFTENPRRIKQQILKFIPSLINIDVHSARIIKSSSLRPIRNLNPDYFNRLTPAHVKKINQIIGAHPDLVNLFGYKLR